MERRCYGNGSSEGEEGARMTFLQGGPKFEVTPLHVGLCLSKNIKCNVQPLLGGIFWGENFQFFFFGGGGISKFWGETPPP